MDVKAAIAEGLKSYGWTVCHCDGEADVCIGQKAKRNPGLVVAASTDSDILFHGVKQLLRKDPRNHTFTSYHVEEILEKLEVTRSQWTVAAVTTNNDYSAQVKSQTFSKNIETARASDSEDPAAVLEKYCTIMNLDNGRFGPSKDVFMDNIETIMTESTSNESIDLAMRGLVDRINVCFQRLKATQRADKSAAVVTAGRTGKASNVPATGRSRKQNRGFRSMVPPNKFTAKTFENKDPATTTLAATKVPRKRKKKEQDNRTRKRAPIFNKCSRNDRRDPTENIVEPGRANKLKPATVIQNCLMKYGTITMTCGTLSTQLRNGLYDNSVGRLDHRQMFRKEVLETITEMIRIGTEVTRCAEQAVCLYISKVMAESTSLDDPDRRERLSTLGFHKDSGCFGNLLQEIFSWHDVNRKKGNKKDSAENSCMSNIITVYKDFLHNNNQDFPRLNDKIQTGLNAFLQLAGRRLADTLQIHYNRNITELINRVRENNQGWANGEGRLFLEDFNDDGKSNSGLHDPISTFWILNSHLPKDKQFAFFPEGGFSDKFFTITEEALLKVLLRDGNPSRKEFLRQEFGSQTSAVQYANEHPGDLLYRLFFSNNIKYNGVCLTNPGPILPATLGLLHVKDESMEHYQGLLNSLANGSASKESREAFKEFVKEQLPNPAAQKEAIDQRANNRRYVIRGSITTNGHELQVPAYSMTQAAPRSSAKKTHNYEIETTRCQGPDHRERCGRRVWRGSPNCRWH
ncbi:hypothetical protein B0O80DRAFT_266241 [Mortierella sp. GBAus27b]|nr:hypothetical protein B0O80DRAFT_266241 [Mortierella sp. GBAus27b]